MKKLSSPCPRCRNWWYPGDHACFDASVKAPPKHEKKRQNTFLQSQERLIRLAEGRDHRWAEERLRNRERDAEIVRLYSEEQLGYRLLAKQFGIAYQTARNVVRRAAAEGLVELREGPPQFQKTV
jgi:hypothetical protein